MKTMTKAEAVAAYPSIALTLAVGGSGRITDNRIEICVSDYRPMSGYADVWAVEVIDGSRQIDRFNITA